MNSQVVKLKREVKLRHQDGTVSALTEVLDLTLTWPDHPNDNPDCHVEYADWRVA